jgi:Na+/proline symporter
MATGSAGPVTVGTLGGYLVVLAAISYYGYRETADETDFLVAGRDVGSVVGAGTLLASQISASTVVGAIGIHYVFGIGFMWVWLGILSGWLLALVFRTLFGVSEATGVVLTGVIAVAYTAAGGMRASVLTDFLQAVVLVGGLAVAVPLALAEVGGTGALLGQLRAIDPELLGQAFPLTEIGGFVLASGFGIVAAPMEIVRFYAMRDEETVQSAIRISLVAQAVIAVCVAVLGLSARVLFPELGTPDMAAIVLSEQVLGSVFGTLFVVAILSAILSTTDSVMLVSSSGIAHDIYARVIRPDATERRKLWVNRGAVALVGAIPIVLALNRELIGGLITLITFLNLSLQAGLLFVPVVFGLHWRRANTPGGLAAMVAGFGTVVLWYVGSELVAVIPGSVATLVGDPVVPGVAASVVALVGVSLLTAPPSNRSTTPFFPE